MLMFMIGLFIGTLVGVLAMALLLVGRRSDRSEWLPHQEAGRSPL